MRLQQRKSETVARLRAAMADLEAREAEKRSASIRAAAARMLVERLTEQAEREEVVTVTTEECDAEG